MGSIQLAKDYPWTTSPLLISAPMYRIAYAPLAVAVSKAGGLGFLAAGLETSRLESDLAQAAGLLSKSPTRVKAADEDILPIGVGFLNWGADLEATLKALEKYTVAAVWFYAPYQMQDLQKWSEDIRRVSGGRTKVWIQVGSVELAIKAVEVCKPDVLVVQGTDAGGHGLVQGAGIITLLPEVVDTFQEKGISIPIVAAGGILDGRGVAACLTLGAVACVMGTRFLAAQEADVKDGYRDEVIRAKDGGLNTVRTSVYDHTRGIYGWPKEYNGRGIINKSYEDAQAGMDAGENKRLYDEALAKGDQGWGPNGRLCTYAGTGIGLVKKVTTADEIIKDTTAEALERLNRTARQFCK